MLVGSIFVGFDKVDAQAGISSIFGVFAAAGAIREKIKGVDFKGWLGNANTWAYLGTIVVTFVPTLPVETFRHLGDIAANAIGGNWQGILVSLFSLGTILYHFFQPKTKPAQA